MADSSEQRLCRLESALGRAERCPEGACPFWDRGSALAGGCTLDELDLAGRPELAALLLRIRGQLEAAESHAADDEARQDLYRLLATGDADGG